METKICRACGEEKELSEYYKQKGMADGHFNKCKECVKKEVRENRAAKADHYREYDRKRADRPDRVAARKAYQKTEAGKEAMGRARKRYVERYPMKRAAHVITGNAIRDGALVRPEAYEACGSSGPIEAHHDNYTKPLDVRWLCRPCHVDWHKHNEPIFQ